MSESTVPASGLTARTETFQLHLEFEWDGGTFAEFETDFQNFSWDIPKFVYFSEPMSGLSANLTLNAFETSIRDRSGDLIHVMAGGVANLHESGALNLGVTGQVDFRVLQFSQARVYLGVTGTATIDPSSGSGAVEFGPAFTVQFGGIANP